MPPIPGERGNKNKERKKNPSHEQATQPAKSVPKIPDDFPFRKLIPATEDYQTPIFLPKKDWSFQHGEETKIYNISGYWNIIFSSAWIKAVAQNLQPLHAWNQNLKCVWRVTQAAELSLFSLPQQIPQKCPLLIHSVVCVAGSPNRLQLRGNFQGMLWSLNCPSHWLKAAQHCN